MRPVLNADTILDQVSVVTVLGDLPPQIFIVAEGEGRFKDFLEVGVEGGDLVIEFERRRETRERSRNTVEPRSRPDDRQ